MLSFNTGVSGLQQFQKQLDVIGNNIVNVNTPGYKSASVEFADTFSETLRDASTSASGSSVSPVQIGTGVSTNAISTNFSLQGNLTDTGNKTDLAVNGDGFFLVRDTATNTVYATRAGQFHVDSSGFLVTSNGLRVQGSSDSGLSVPGDIKIDNTKDGTTPLAYTDPPDNTKPATLNDYTIGSDGTVNVTLNGMGGTPYPRGQILLQRFTNPQALTKEGYNLYSGLAAAGPLGGTTPQSQAPNTYGLGLIKTSALESSNVDLTSQMTGMITAERAFQACSKIITTSDELMQEVVNLKR
jgi:flagellar hook protein FlgE